MWSHDEDDNLLYVFHARTDNNGLSGRDMFVRRVHFAADGLPIFDMEADEEVAPGNRSVSVTVTVVGAAEPALEVSAVTSTRCVAGKVVQTLTVTNREGVPVTVSVTGRYGAKAFAALAPGKTTSATFTTRQTSIPAGSMTLTATASVGGETVTVQDEVAYTAGSCG